MPKPRKKRKAPKRVLALPDLEQSKSPVLNTLTSKSGQQSYARAIDDFVEWYCSEPRLAFNRTVVLRYRIHLEQKQYAPTTINLRLAAVRRVAYEAADSGLLSPELAAGIRRVKGVRRLGVRVGNWLTAEQGKRLLQGFARDNLRGRRSYAMLAMLIGSGLRRGELLSLSLDSIQVREEHWVIADLIGKGCHIRTVPIPSKHSGCISSRSPHHFFSPDGQFADFEGGRATLSCGNIADRFFCMGIWNIRGCPIYADPPPLRSYSTDGVTISETSVAIVRRDPYGFIRADSPHGR